MPNCNINIIITLNCLSFQQVTFGLLPGTSDQSVLIRLREVMIKIFCPILRLNTDWGQLDQTPQGKKTCRHFIDVCDNFVQTLHSKICFKLLFAAG